MEQKTNVENLISTVLYQKDADTLRELMRRKRIKAIRDAVRICVEFTNAHGGLA